MFEQYRALGGDVELVAYGTFGKDAHQFLAYPEAMSIWIPRVDTFLKRIGLPHVAVQPQVLPALYPSPTGYAAVDDVAAVPFLSDGGRQTYRAFLTQEMSREFVLSPDGTAGVAWRLRPVGTRAWSVFEEWQDLSALCHRR